jgi:hypothetical protein
MLSSAFSVPAYRALPPLIIKITPTITKVARTTIIMETTTAQLSGDLLVIWPT